jgi:hypothetical protein
VKLLKNADTLMVSQEQYGWIMRRGGSGMVKIKDKSLFHREGGLLSFLQDLQYQLS